MGKKNKLDFTLTNKKEQKLLDRYGIKGASYGNPARGGTQRMPDEVRKDLADAMMKDYDTREVINSGARRGDDDAKRFAKKGIKSGNLDDAWAYMQQAKKDLVGGGGMSGAKNIAGLTYAAQKEYDKDVVGAGAKKDNDESDIPTLDYYDTDDSDDGLEYYSEGEKAKSRQEAYERRIAPEYFGADEYRDGFRERLQKAMNSVKVA